MAKTYILRHRSFCKIICFERFLARLSQSEYRDKFVIKGGMLIASIVGLDIRSTMDLDTTLRG